MKSSNDTIKRLFEEAEELGVKIHMIESYDQIKYEIINLFLDHPNLDKSICVVDSENYDTQSLSNYLYEKGFDLLLPNEQVDYGEFIENLKNVQVGITSVDACVGETCTLIIRNRRPFFREVSLLPPVYIAVVRQDQIVISLDDPSIFKELKGESQITIKRA